MLLRLRFVNDDDLVTYELGFGLVVDDAEFTDTIDEVLGISLTPAAGV